MSKVLIYSQEDLDLILELEKEKNEQLQQENKQLKDNIKQIDDSVDKLQKQLIKEKDNWNKLKEYIMNDINSRNNSKIIKFEDGRKVMEIVSSLYSVMQDKSKTMKEVLDKMQELKQGSDSNE